jgi:nucleotide-binding universal stress UspA family protein
MKILLPIDGSDCANQTLDWAAETFNKQNSRYFLLFVIPVLPDLNTVEYDIVDATAMLRKARNHMEALGCSVERTEYALGDVVDQICRYAQEVSADQIVLGSHGRTGLAKLLMGSTSMKVLEHSHQCAVTVHRHGAHKQLLAEESPAFTESTLL